MKQWRLMLKNLKEIENNIKKEHRAALKRDDEMMYKHVLADSERRLKDLEYWTTSKKVKLTAGVKKEYLEEIEELEHNLEFMENWNVYQKLEEKYKAQNNRRIKNDN